MLLDLLGAADRPQTLGRILAEQLVHPAPRTPPTALTRCMRPVTLTGRAPPTLRKRSLASLVRKAGRRTLVPRMRSIVILRLLDVNGGFG